MAEPLTLASQGNYWRFAQIAKPGASIVRLPRSWTRERLGTTIEVAGWWGRVGRLTAAVYAHGGELLVQLGDQVIVLDRELSVQHSQARVVRRLVIGSAGARLFASSYLRPLRSVVHVYDNWATEGYYDFGAFISEIAERAFLPGERSLLSIWPFDRDLDREMGERVLAG